MSTAGPMLSPADQGVLFILAGSLGFFLSRTRTLGRLAGAISFLNVWIALPGLFFVIYFARGILPEDIGIVAFSATFILVLVGLLLVASRGMAADVRGTMVLDGSFVNSVNIPFPILQAIMGTYAYAATFAATTGTLQILVARMLQQHLGTGTTGGARASLARTAPLVALAAGVLLHYPLWPAVPSAGLLEGTDLIENALIAVIYLHFGAALGASLVEHGQGPRLASRPFLTTALTRCIIGPILALLLALPFGEGSAVYLQMVFVASMPPAILNTLMSHVYGFDADSSAKWTTILTPLNTAEAVALLLILGG